MAPILLGIDAHYAAVCEADSAEFEHLRTTLGTLAHEVLLPC